jgi:hypothetical protein
MRGVSWRRGPREMVARQINLFCAPQLMGTEGSPPVPNGGSARGYQRELRDVGVLADPWSAQHAGARPEYLCTAVLHGECSLAADRVERREPGKTFAVCATWALGSRELGELRTESAVKAHHGQ